ncbi:MAG: aryl-sulfate sulfotransferase, partial [Paludibacter sp.]
MKTINTFILSLFLFFVNQIIFSQSFQYISPIENSTLVSLKTNIILKSIENIDVSTLSPKEFVVEGNKSGRHSGIVKLSDDKKTILFIPNEQFAAAEVVTVMVNSGIRTISGVEFSQVSFHFKTTTLSDRINLNSPLLNGMENLDNMSKSNTIFNSLSQSINPDSLPSDFPKITVGTSNNPAEGKIFLSDLPFGATAYPIGNFIMILNNDGSVEKYKRTDQPAFDFTVQPNGEPSYAGIIGQRQSNGTNNVCWIVMDTSLTPVDTFQCGNGYVAEEHDFRLLPNGHALLMAYDPEPVDMSAIVAGGDPNAIVIGAIIQELDAEKNVIFQWRSWDYVPITDSYVNLTMHNIDYFHMNAFDIDTDGNILISARQFSSVFKIDRQTGKVLWVLGGKKNEFTFLNENESNSPNYFSLQHDLRVLPNGDITLFDNGNQHLPNSYSRGVEYKLDEQNKIADMVWEYRHSPDIFGSALGSVQRLSNGNTLIGWGMASATGSPALTEIHPDYSVAFEMFLPKGETSYRAFRFPWVSQAPEATVTLIEALQGNTYTLNNSTDTTGIAIKFSQLSPPFYTNFIVGKYNYSPINPLFSTIAPIIVPSYFTIEGQGVNSYTGNVEVDLNNYPAVINPQKTVIYVKPDSSNIFSPLPTSYDSTNHKLLFTTTDFGEFTFGIPQNINSVYAPVSLLPKESEIVNGEAPVKLAWGTLGVVATYNLQVATDSLFNNLVLNALNLSNTSYILNSLSENKTYYWRVNNTNTAGISYWSKAMSFLTQAPLIKISFP